MDKVFIRDLKIDTLIGVYDWERQVRQTVHLDLELAHSIQAAAAQDDIGLALNYKEVADHLSEFVANSEFTLIETLAEHCAHILLDKFQVPWLRLTVRKPGAVVNASDVGVVIERSQSNNG